MESILREELDQGVLVLTFHSAGPHNPVSRALERAIIAACKRAEEDESVHAVVLWGGPERSFSAGGDFNEVKNLAGGPEVKAWIEGTLELYRSILDLTKPTVAAVDRYAIGIGFQLALTCDWRVGTERCQFIMPELKHGIACSLGSYMLEKSFGRLAMTELIYGGEPVDAPTARRMSLLNELSSVPELLATARAAAARLAGYPQLPLRRTKRFANTRFSEGLREIASQSVAIHSEAFAHKTAQAHFKAVLGAKYAAGASPASGTAAQEAPASLETKHADGASLNGHT
ncbi:enoyl-CoA hydratase/isomerase family protein [Hyalangium rubrum]|uniref:Enoyl-CoA hydratase/isomerase family protein n=1 Tax=Hyalangium rubrum TaxID=3103134 RepID=A0ABU5H5H8_9BACT|nr:enoyl-CoA hydratase/isomerase family protein [Hyalangium sp. s54d21]MDY7228339.1 enoyl-CoA hydratase/isomerase family protein [Hyalangium sp. s54d21]